MFVLMLFAFIGGVVTILSPCILPILPIVLSSGVSGGKRKPLGVVTGFILSFTFFTLFLATIVRLTGLSADFLRTLAAVTLLLFGLVMVVPQLQAYWERLVSILSSRGSMQSNKGGFLGGLPVGLSLGLVWAPCVGPILAGVITLAATSTVTGTALLVTLAYSLGTAIPMLLILYGSRRMMRALPVLKQNSKRVQQVFGAMMMIAALAIWLNWDRQFQTFILDQFPGYGEGLTQIEDNSAVRQELDNLLDREPDDSGTTQGMNFNDREYSAAPGFEGGGTWLNTDPLVLEDLRGKVVLVDFWTYSCINCIRTLPYITAWHEKYADEGLVIVGVHTPEFEFEKDTGNVVEAMEDFGIKYAVVQDNDFKIWREYNNRYWPAKYFIDKQGRIRDTHFGEGAYDESERFIQELLSEDAEEVSQELVDIPEFEHETRTPETYLGYWRIAGFSSPEGIRKDKLASYTTPSNLSPNSVAYGGKWEVMEKYAAPKTDSTMVLRFDAKDVHLVMRPKNGDGKVLVFLDGKEIGETDAGDDVVDGEVTISKDRLYTLVSLDEPGDHVLTLKFLDDDVEVYAFTFG